MIKNLLKYPDPTIRLISANVRFFNDELKEWIADMIDTMRAHDLSALSAIMIGVQYNIIVMKEANSYTPYINARLIKHADVCTKTERSTYYEGISVDVDRYDKVTVIYEDTTGESHHCDLAGEDARMFQQQLDYCYGSTFVDRVDRETKIRINDYLSEGLVKDAKGGSCPVVFYRDYFKRGAKYAMALILLSFISPFFVSSDVREWITDIDKVLLLSVVGLMIGYFFYALYESRQYKQCTSCQTGNIIGTLLILAGQWFVVGAGVFFWMAS